jgi:FkbM family methyltransferase
VQLSRYAVKRAALAPRTRYRRYRSRDLDPGVRQLLETQSYGRSMYDFIAAVAANPDLLTDVPITDAGVAVDLGAYVGDWSQRMLERYRCTVYAFEPSPGAAAKAAERVRDAPNATVFDFGVGAADGTALLARDGPGSSVYGGKGQFGSVSVPIRDIVTVLDELGVQFVDVLKLNVEGAEYDLLDRLIEADWLSRIGMISVQFHEWHPNAHRRRTRIRRALRASHEQEWNYPWVWELWRPRR